MNAPVPTRAAGPRGRGLLLVVVALVVSAVAASATAVALSSRSDLSASRSRIEAAWEALRPVLDGRYQRLAAAAVAAQEGLGAERAVFADIAREVAGWSAAARQPVERQVAAAARLEGLAGRLAATAAATPRLRSDGAVTEALERLRHPDTAAARGRYNGAVEAYQRARGGFPRRLVAGALGYDDRRTLEVPT